LKTKLLRDSHVPADVAGALRALRPGVDVEHVGLGDVLALDVELLAGLTITGTIGETYRVEYTTDLNEPRDWRPLVTLVLPTSPYRYLLEPVSGGPKRFYRAVQAP
jgi:hypothetical protein